MSKRIIAYFMVAVLISSSILTSYKALAFNSFYSQNDILFYDSNAVDCASSSPNTGTVVGSKNLETVLNYFTSKGLSLAAAAGIAGNFQAETNMSIEPASIQSGGLATEGYEPKNGDGFGIAQWSYFTRQAPLYNLATKTKTSIIDLNFQLDYAWAELTTTYFSVLSRLNTISSTTVIGSASAPMAAAIVFHGGTPDIKASAPQKEITDVNPAPGFEGSGDTGKMVVDNRGKRAESIYNTYRDKIADGTGVTDITIETTSSYSATSGCSSPSGDATWPENVEAHGSKGGWTLKENTDYSATPCASGSTDLGPTTHTIFKFIIRQCSTDLGIVSSLISGKVIALIADAKQSGIILTGDGYRSYEGQIKMRTTNGCADIMTTPPSECKTQTAIPGTSMHERGLAIDVINIQDEGSPGPAWNWFVNNAAKYGFINLPAENWHWSMSGN